MKLFDINIVFSLPGSEENIALNALMGLHTWVNKTSIWILILFFFLK